MSAVSYPVPTTSIAAQASAHAFARALPWVVVALVLGAGISVIDALPVGVMWDDGMYVVLAKSLATGHGYRWINLPAAPPATHFPPGYPAFLALLWWLAPSISGKVVLFKLANACFLAGIALLLLRFLRERFQLGSLAAAVFALLSVLSIPMLSLSVVVMSEPCFLMLLLVSLLLAERIACDADVAARRLVWFGLLLGVATLVRTQGIALIAAVSITLLMRRRVRAAALSSAVALLVIAPWLLWSSAQSGIVPPAMRGSYDTYGSWLASGVRAEGLSLFGRTALHTSAEIGAMFASFTAPGMPGWMRMAALAMLVALAVVGARVLWRGAPVTALFLLLYAALTIFWPFPPARFVWGVWPLVLLVPVLGAREISGWHPRETAPRVLRGAGLAAAALLIMGHAKYCIRGYWGEWWASIPRANALQLRPLVRWASRHTSPGEVLGVESESAVYLYAGRFAVPIQTFTARQFLERRTAAENAQVLRSILSRYSVTAVAVSGPITRDAARELATARPPELVVRDTFPGGIVLAPATR